MIKSKYRKYVSLKAVEKQLQEDIDKLQTKVTEKLSKDSKSCGNPFLNFYSALGDDQNRIKKNYELQEIKFEMNAILFQFTLLIGFVISLLLSILTVILS